MKRRLCAIALLFLLSACASAPPSDPPTATPEPTKSTPTMTPPAMTAGTYELNSPGGNSYTLYLPPDYDPDVPSPLAVSLHYAGYNGPHYGRALLEFAMIGGLRELNPIIVAPDSPNWRTADGADTAIEVTELILNSYNIDRSRVLLTGYSNGGMGTWAIAANHQDLYTGAMPMAALPLSDSAETQWQIPLLVLNSDADELFDFDEAKTRTQALADAGATVNFVAVNGVGHYSAEQFTAHIQTALPWLLEQWSNSEKSQ